jgi:hypothetical protein
MISHRFEKEIEDGGRKIVVADADAGHKPGFAIDEAMLDNLEANQA